MVLLSARRLQGAAKILRRVALRSAGGDGKPEDLANDLHFALRKLDGALRFHLAHRLQHLGRLDIRDGPGAERRKYVRLQSAHETV